MAFTLSIRLMRRGNNKYAAIGKGTDCSIVILLAEKMAWCVLLFRSQYLYQSSVLLVHSSTGLPFFDVQKKINCIYNNQGSTIILPSASALRYSSYFFSVLDSKLRKKCSCLSFQCLNGLVVIRMNFLGYLRALYSSSTSFSFRFRINNDRSRRHTFRSSLYETNSNLSIIFIGSSRTTPCLTDFRKAMLSFNYDSDAFLSQLQISSVNSQVRFFKFSLNLSSIVRFSLASIISSYLLENQLLVRVRQKQLRLRLVFRANTYWAFRMLTERVTLAAAQSRKREPKMHQFVHSLMKPSNATAMKGVQIRTLPEKERPEGGLDEKSRFRSSLSGRTGMQVSSLPFEKRHMGFAVAFTILLNILIILLLPILCQQQPITKLAE